MMPAGLAQLIVLAIAALLIVAALHDTATRTVPNWISFAILCCGVALRLADGGLITGLILTFAVFLTSTLVWWFGLFGGGDVKLLSAATLAIPPEAVAPYILLVALAGGALALTYLALQRLVPRPAPGFRSGFLARVLKAEAWRLHRRAPLPYAAAIAVGGIISLLPH
jgi:prepilin peptidase CpaA